MPERTVQTINKVKSVEATQQAVPGSDVPSLPPGWVWTTLGDITSPSRERVDPTRVPDALYVGLEHIEKDSGRLLEHGSAADVRSTKTVFHAGDVLYGKLRPYLNKVCIPDFDGICSTDILVFPRQSHLDNHFLKYRLLSSDFVQFANIHVGGVQHPRVHFNQLAQFRMALPPLPEQRRIVARIEELFSQLDAAEEGLRRVQRNLKRYRASVFKAAVEGRLVPTQAELAQAAGRPYETGAELLQRILAERRRKWEEQEWAKLVEKAKKKAVQARRKARGLPARMKDIPPEEWQGIPEDEYRRYLPKDDRWKQKYKEPTPPDTAHLPPLPEGWAWVTVEMMASSIRYGYTQPAQSERVGPKFLRITDIQRGEVNWEQVPYCVPPSSAQELEKFRLAAGDIVFARTGATTGKSYLIKHLPSEALFASYLIRLRLVPGILPDFLYFYFNSPFYWTQIASLQKGMAQPGVNATLLAGLPVPLPPLAGQRRIAAEVERRLSVAREAEKAVEANRKRIARLRQAILKRAFEGKLVPQDPSDEPVKVLLERIRAGETEIQDLPLFEHPYSEVHS